MALKKLKMQEVITRMFKQYGLSDQEVKTVIDLGNANDDIEVEEDLANKLGSNLLTVDAAKANPEVRKAITGEALNGFDALGNQLVEEYKIPDEKLAEIKAEKSTHKRIKMITNLIAELNGELAKLKETHAGELESLKTGFNVERVGAKVSDIYSQLEYAMADVPKDVAIAAARGVMKQIEDKDGVEYKLTDNGLELFKKDGTPYFDPVSNKPLPPVDYIQRNLQTNKLLKVSAPPGNGPKPPAKRPAPAPGAPEVKIMNREELTQTLENARSQTE
jgi:hypothetical protein